MFNFNDLKDYTKVAQCSIDEIAARVGISYDGLKRGLQNESLSLRYVLPLCQELHMTPNQFFGSDAPAGDIVYGDQQKGSKMKIKKDSPELAHAISILQDELKQKNEQLAAKDRTIAEKDQQIADINKQLLSKILAL